MKGLKTLACCLLIVVLIPQEAHSRVVKMETVFEVEAETFEMKSLQSFGPKVCKVIDGHNVCAAALSIKLPQRLTVLITVDGEEFMSLNVSNGNPPPKCEFVAKYGNVCVTIDNVDLENLKGCAKISALGRVEEIGCFQATI